MTRSAWFRRAVGDDRTLHAREDGLDVGLVETEHDRAIEWDAIHKLQEDVLDFVEGFVLVEVLAVDGGDHGHDRREQQK